MTIDEAVALLREAQDYVGFLPTRPDAIEKALSIQRRIDAALAAHDAEPAEVLLFSPDRCCPGCGSIRLALDETTMLSFSPPRRPAECRNCGNRFAIPATGFLIAKPKEDSSADETERLREQVKQLKNRDRDAIKWRDRWRSANAEGLRLREALTVIAVGDHEGLTPEERAQVALDGDEE